MKTNNRFEINIVKITVMTFILALVCILIPTAITSYAATNKIEISQSVYNLAIGQTVQIDADFSGGTLTFKSENVSICTVDENGLVTALDTGSTRIAISTTDGTAETAYCEINVNMINSDSTKIIFDSDTYTYTGYQIEPDIEVYYGDTLLKLYNDYDVIYNNNNIDVGTVSITIKGMAYKGIGKYSGELTTSFTITQKDINDVIISDSFGMQTYKGTPLTPDIDVFMNWDYNSKLVKGKDYILTYANNINVGTATVTVRGIGNFTGEATLEFIIYAADINNDVDVSVENVTYTGSAVTPDILAKIENYRLVLGKEYTLSYSNNVNIGTATITITGIGNVRGIRVIEFKIIPKANSLTAYSKPKKTSLRLDWTKASGITGYKIYVYDSSAKKYVLKKTIKNPNTLYCTVKGLTAGNTYSFKIATYLTVDGADYISNLSVNVLEAMTVPADSKIVQLVGKNHSVQIRWKKINGASGYIIYRYKKNKFVKIAKIKGNTKFTYTNKNLKKSKTYKYKVIAYKQLNGKTLKGKISAKKSVLTLSFRWPVPGFYYISQTFNNKSSMYASGNHSGTDIASKGKSIKGAKIIATRGGKVDSINKGCKHNYGKTKSCGCGGGFGNYVVVRSTFKIDGKKVTLRVIYGHMTSVKVKVGQYVSSGQVLGTVGSTGYSTGPHLHFEFRIQNSPSAKIKKRLNPLYYVKH